MTVAVCLRCGEFKHGAFTCCQKCGHHPKEEEDLTRHLLATDHCLDHDALAAIAENVKSGEPVQFDPEVMKEAWVKQSELDEIEKDLDRTLKPILRGCIVVAGIIFVLIIAAAVRAIINIF